MKDKFEFKELVKLTTVKQQMDYILNFYDQKLQKLIAKLEKKNNSELRNLIFFLKNLEIMENKMKDFELQFNDQNEKAFKIIYKKVLLDKNFKTFFCKMMFFENEEDFKKFNQILKPEKEKKKEQKKEVEIKKDKKKTKDIKKKDSITIKKPDFSPFKPKTKIILSEILKLGFEEMFKKDLIDLEILNEINILPQNIDFWKKIFQDLMDNLKRGENSQQIQESIENHIKILKKEKKITLKEKKLIERVNDEKYLVNILFCQSDEEVKLRLNKKLSIVPFIYKNFKKEKNECGSIIDINLGVAIESIKTFGILSLSISDYIKNPASFINKIFKTKFETNSNNDLHDDSVDIDFGYNFFESRKLTFMNHFGTNIENKEYFWKFLLKFVNVVIIFIHPNDLFEEMDKKIKNFLDLIENCSTEIIFVVYGERKYEKSCYKKNIFLKKIKFIDVSSQKLDRKNSEGEDLNEDEINEFKENLQISIKENEQKFVKKIETIFNKNQNNFKFTSKNLKKNILKSKFSFSELNSCYISDENNLFDKQKREDYFEEREKKRNEFKEIMDKTWEFISSVEEYIQKKNLDDSFKMSELFYMKYHFKKLIQKEEKNMNLENIKNITEKLGNIKEQINLIEPSDLIQKFYYLITNEKIGLIMETLAVELGKIEKKYKTDLEKELKNLLYQQKSVTNEEELEEIKKKILKKNIDICLKSVSLEIMFRNLLSFSERENSINSWFDDEKIENLKKSLTDLMKKGFSIEVVDGESLECRLKTIKEALSSLGSTKTKAVAIIGPQSSGKSTLFNYKFGTRFLAGQGRCTKGMNLVLQKVIKNYQEEYLLVIDTEGLHSTEKNDPEFDKKVCTFILENVNIVIVNMKDDFSNEMKNDLETAIYGVSVSKSFEKPPNVFFIFNQRNDTSNKKPYLNQIKILNTDLKQLSDSLPNSSSLKFNLCNDQIRIFEKAFSNEEMSFNGKKYSYSNVVSTFSKSVRKFGSELLEIRTEKEDISSFFEKLKNSWDKIEKYPEIIQLEDIKQISIKIKMEKSLDNKFDDLLNFSKESREKFLINSKKKLDVIESVDEIEKTIDKMKKEFIYKNQIEFKKFKNEREYEEKQNENYKVSLFDAKMQKLEREFRLIEINTICSMEKVSQEIIIKKFREEGVKEFFDQALKLTRDKKFKGLNKNDQKEKCKEIFSIKFKEKVERFEKRLDIELLKIQQFKVIKQYLDEILLFSPKIQLKNDEKYPKIYEFEEGIEYLQENFIKLKEKAFVVTKRTIRKIEDDIQNRFQKTFNFLNFKEGKDYKFQTNYLFIDDLENQFDYEKFILKLKKIILSKADLLDIKGKILSKIELFNNIGIEFSNFHENNLDNFLQQKDLDFKKVDEFFKNNLNQNQIVIKSETKKITSSNLKFFKINQIYLSNEEKNKIEPTAHYFKKKGKTIKLLKSENTKLDDDFNFICNKENIESPFLLQEKLLSILKNYINFDFMNERIENIIFKTIDASVKSFTEQTKDLREISYQNFKQMLKTELNSMINNIDDDMQVFGAEISDEFVGKVGYLIGNYIWKIQISTYKSYYEHIIEDFKIEEKNYLQKFISIAIDEKPEEVLINLRQTLRENIDFFSEQVFLNENINNKFEQFMIKQKGNYNHLNVINDVNKIIFEESGAYDFENDNLNNQFQTFKYEKIIEEFKIKKKQEKEILKNSLIDKLKIQIKFSIEISKEILNVYKENCNKMETFSNFKIFSNENKEITSLANQKKLKDKIAEFFFEIIEKVLKGESNFSLSKNVTEKDEDYVIKLDFEPDFIFKFLEMVEFRYKKKEIYDSLVLDSSLNLSMFHHIFDCIKKIKDSNRIYVFDDFFETIREGFENYFSDIKNSKFSKKIDGRLNMGNCGLEIQKKIQGCQFYCSFCYSKCEQEDDDHLSKGIPHCWNHFGHNIRLFNKIYITKGKQFLPSLLTCDTIDIYREVKIGNSEKTTLKLKYEGEMGTNIDIKNLRSIDGGVKERINQNQKYIDRNFTAIQRYFNDRQGIQIENPGMTIPEFIQQYNTVGFLEKGHYYICIDESGSMSGSPWIKAKAAVSNCVKHLLNKGSNNSCNMSFSCFSHICRNIFDFNILSENTLNKIESTQFKSGGTNFEPILNMALDSVESKISDVDFSMITIVTDGWASYPQTQINRIKTMINNNRRVYLHWITIVERRSQREIQSGFCFVDENIPTFELGNKMIEIMDLMNKNS